MVASRRFRSWSYPLDGGAVGYGLIGVDALIELLAVEELGQQLLHLSLQVQPFSTR